MGRWGDGEMGRWGGGEVGRWGEIIIYCPLPPYGYSLRDDVGVIRHATLSATLTFLIIFRYGELVALGNQPGIIGQEHLSIDEMEQEETHPKGEEELVPC
ncbi:hypothetical protein [Trichormus sp. NMC-1]|uniref:hypothetical protein n=1 Tax=Trichormus sp. NMC-1 TaxID=1853259 RepID=UPI0008DC0A67|nr:hypothetical protein [Trichormus sp. NMC-1]